MPGIPDSPQFPTRKMSFREIELTGLIHAAVNGATIKNKLSFGRQEAMEELDLLYAELHELKMNAGPSVGSTTRMVPVAGLDESHAEKARLYDEAERNKTTGGKTAFSETAMFIPTGT